MTAPPDLSSRYGKRMPAALSGAPAHGGTAGASASGRPRRRRTAAIATAAALAIGCAAIGWIAFSPADSPQGGKNLSYEVVDSTLTRATVSVVPDAQRDITCGIRAINEHDAVVGYVERDVPADPAADASDPVVLHAEIATTQLAASGHIDACWFADSPPG
ncbi:DUF4307 domain-containing protein [Brevibacterium album]|uniref:DUF4307 domain-containing protein n=1 Tax=Brevibacterium album TaxID=417948 RepID=UPI00041F4E96|nr:DUF4307 domain-containing protein [Brevibacterium album]